MVCSAQASALKPYYMIFRREQAIAYLEITLQDVEALP